MIKRTIKRVSVVLFLFLFSSSLTAVYAKTPQDTFVIARNTADLITFDPAEVFEFTGARIVSNMYERLMTFEPNDTTTLVKGVAESYSFSEDGKRITLKIREGIQFQSGNPLKAEDVAFSLQRAVKLNKTPAFIIKQIGWTENNVEEAIRALDERTVELDIMADLSPALVLNLLSANISSVVDKKEVLAHEVDGDLGHAWLRAHSAGSGPYKLKTWKANELIMLEVNPRYHKSSPKMKRIVFRHVGEASAQRLMVEKGDVDVAMDLNSDQVMGMKGKDGVTVDEYEKGYLMYMAVNMEHPVLSHPKFLEALRYTVDYKGMANSFLKGQYTIHQSFWPKGMWASNNEISYQYDLKKAAALLSEVNLPEGEEIIIDTLNKSPFKEVAQSIQINLNKLGVKAKIVLSDGKTLWPKYRARRHHLIVARWGPDYSDPHSNADAFAHNPDNREAAKLTGKLTWRNAWDASIVTPMTEQAAKETDLDKRYDIYQALQQEVRENSPFIVMFQSIGLVGRRDNVDGFINGATSEQAYYSTVVKK